MAGYDVYGVGHALVDVEFEVPGDFLERHGLTKGRDNQDGVRKGAMTLVGEGFQREVMGLLRGAPRRRSCGGSAANSLAVVAGLGGRAFLSCRVADDELGDLYRRDLLDRGIESALSEREGGGATGRCLVLVTPDAERTMLTFPGVTADFREADLREEELARSRLLYVEGYLLAAPRGRRMALGALDRARRLGVRTALTLSDPSVPARCREAVREVLDGGVDLLFCNEEEAMVLTGAGDVREAAALLRPVAGGLAVTRGREGALLWDGRRETDVGVAEARALDTNGAGDAFAGAFLHGVLAGHDFGRAGRLACAAGRAAVQRFGARLDGRSLRALREEAL